MSDGGTTRLGPLTVKKLVERALSDSGVTATRIEIYGKTIRIAASGLESKEIHAALPFEFWLDSGLLEYNLELELG